MKGKAYRKKPVRVWAIQFTGDNAFEIWEFMGRNDLLDNMELKHTDRPVIATMEGNMTCSPGDYVIKGIKGEFYPCKPDIFEATYEPATEGDDR